MAVSHNEKIQGHERMNVEYLEGRTAGVVLNYVRTVDKS